MTITVLFFAKARELAAASSVALELPDRATVAQLREALVKRFPAFGQLLAVSRIAVNHEFADDPRVLAAADEVAVIPPVSGG